MEQAELLKTLAAWRDAVGADHVLTDGDSLSAVQAATFATSQQVLAVLRPQNRGEVQAALHVANRYQTPVYPISKGRNWGLGSRVPASDRCAVLDLSRMNRIVDYNERLAYITVEPGVTFQQAFDFLQAERSSLLLSATGGPAEGSLIGNTAERGDGMGPYGERLSHACGFEVVLPTGECLQTGFGRFDDALAASVSRYGVGPYVDGLFTQSNLGIITRMTMWLMPQPRYLRVVACRIDRRERLAALLDNVGRLELEGALSPNCFGLWNSYKYMSVGARYPWFLVGDQTPLQLSQLYPSEPWYGSAVIHSAVPQMGEAQTNHVVATLQDHVDECRVESHFPPSLFGTPTDQNVKSMYWRKQNPVPTDVDPDRDRCGVLWLCHALPLDGAQVLESVSLVERIVQGHGFEPNLGLSCVDGRSVHQYLAILYDRQLTKEDERAMACHDDVLEQLAAAGVLPYRLGIHSMDALPSANAGYGTLLAALKRSLDPANVLAPGRYDFRREWPAE